MSGEGKLWLHRRSLDSAVFQSANLWQVWCWCLMKATYKERKIFWNGQEMTLKPGQFLAGRYSGAKECHMRPSTFRNQIALLKKLGNLDISSDSHSSLIRVVKWHEFQENGTSSRMARTGERTTGGQPEDTNNKERRKEKDTLFSEAESVYDFYKSNVTSGDRANALKSILKVLKTGLTKEQLTSCVDRYSANGMSPDRQYRIQCNNFFGRAERFREYLSEQSKEVIEQDIQQHLARELIARNFEDVEKFKWIAGTDLVHYSGHKDCLAECRKLGLVKKGIEQ